MLTLGCKALGALVDSEIANRTKETRGTWTQDQVMRALDFGEQELWNVQAQAVQDHLLDSLDVNVVAARAAGQITPIAAVQQGIMEYRLPESVGIIRRIESTSMTEPRKIDFVRTSSKDAMRDSASNRGSAYWIWSKWSNVRGTIGFIGGASMTSFRIWYVRRPAPLHHGQAKSGKDGTGVEIASTIARIWLDKGTGATAGAGEILQKDDVYRGSVIKFSGVPAASSVIGVSDQVRLLISASAVSISAPVQSAVLWSFDETLPFDCATFFYEMVPQTYPEHYRLLILLAAKQLLIWAGAIKQVALIEKDLPRHWENFEQMQAVRQHQDGATMSAERRYA